MDELELHIERLVLHDLPGHQRHRIAAAITAELERLVAEQGLPPGMAASGSIELPSADITVTAGARPEAIGRQVAQSLYRSFAGGSARPETAAPAPRSEPTVRETGPRSSL
jgi:hypothetical protein